MLRHAARYSSILLCLVSLSAWSGVEIGGSRIVYEGSSRQASISVSNPDERPYLVQAWVNKNVNSDDNDQTFIATPPLFRLEPHSQNSVRVVYTGKPLPMDRESVYWLNIKTIPSTDRDARNQLLITVKSKMKLFFRPDGLKGEPQEAVSRIAFRDRGGMLVVDNPTPYNVSFYDLTIGGKKIDQVPMAAPLQETPVKQPFKAGQMITWRAINDFGGISKQYKTKI